MCKYKSYTYKKGKANENDTINNKIERVNVIFPYNNRNCLYVFLKAINKNKTTEDD